jgi:hypothetical protein
MNAVKLKLNKNNLSYIFWIGLLAAGMLSFLIYGLSFFASKPTVETITTRAPQSSSNIQPMQNAKFQSNKKH